jgi:hypothetical protein
MSDDDFVLAHTRAWVERVVIGLNLCPFAKGPQAKGLVRYALFAGSQPMALLEALEQELRLLAAAPADRLETTLLVHPGALQDFADYNDFLDPVDALLGRLGLEGRIQVASFHPQYRFAGTHADDVANATNRSPYPLLHLIREQSIDRAVAAMPQAESIYEANIATMRRLGTAGWTELQERCRAQALAACRR